MINQTDIDEQEFFRMITQAHEDNELWFELKITLPYAKSQQHHADALQENMRKILIDGMNLISENIDQVETKKTSSRIHLIK